MFLKKLSIIFIVTTSMTISQNGLIYAQEPQAFDSLQIGLKYTANINRNIFHDFYEPGKGIEGFVEMPFYYGDIQTAVQVLSYSAKKKGLPSSPSLRSRVNSAKGEVQGFHGIFTHLKWGKQYSLPCRMGWFTGIGIGLCAFLPNNPTWSDPYEVAHFTETELSASLNSHLSYPIYQNWTMRLEGSYNRIFTYKQIDLAYFSIGIGYSFATPKWIKVFLE